MTLKIEALPQLTSYEPPRKGETGAKILASHRRARTTAALVAGIKATSGSRRVAHALDVIAGRASL